MGYQPGTVIDFCDHTLHGLTAASTPSADYWTDASNGAAWRGLTWHCNGTSTMAAIEDPLATPGEGRLVLHRVRNSNATGTGQRVGFATDVKYIRHGLESTNSLNRTVDDIVFTIRFCWSKAVSAAAWTGQLNLLHGVNSGTNVIRVGLGSATGEIGYIIGTGSTVTLSGSSVAEGTWAQLTVRYKKSTGTDGILEVWIDDTKVVNVTNHTNTNAPVASTNSFLCDLQVVGTINAAHIPINVYTSHIGVCDALSWASASIWNQTPSLFLPTLPFAGMNIGECRTNRVSIAHYQHAGAYNYAWRAANLNVKVEYSTDSGLASSTTTSAVDALAADRWVCHIPITGLAANTTYYYRVKANQDGVPALVVNSPIRQFKTLPATGTVKVGNVHCVDQAGGCFEYAALFHAQGVDFVEIADDYIYNESSDSSTGPHAEKDGYLREMTMPLEDRLLQRLAHYRHIRIGLGDHSFEDGVNNSVLGGYQKGYIDTYGVNLTGNNATAYAANSTCQNAFLAGSSGIRTDNRTITAISTHTGGVSTVTTSAVHSLVPGRQVTLASTDSTPSANGTHTIIDCPTSTTFRITLSVTVAGTTGTAAGAAVKVPTLWDTCREAWYKFVRAGQPNLQRFAATPPANAWEDTEEFEFYTVGNGLAFMWIGSREWQDWLASPGYPEEYNTTGQPCMIGKAFQDWMLQQLISIPATTRLLVLFQQSPFGAHNSVDDNWEQVSTYQRNIILAMLRQYLPASCKVVFVGGDRHWRELDTGARFVAGVLPSLTSGLDYSDMVLAEILPGPGSKAVLGQGELLSEIADTTGILVSDGAGVTRSPVTWLRSACISTFNAQSRTCAVSFYHFEGTTLSPTADNSTTLAGSDDPGGTSGRATRCARSIRA